MEVVFKDENNNDIRLVFSKDNYQLIKSEIIFENGGIKTSYYTDIRLNEVRMPTDMPSLEYLQNLY